MAAEPRPVIADATVPFAPGPLMTLSRGDLQVEVAPDAGGRIAQISWRGEPQLAGYSATNGTMIGWGCYPMVPWAGRVRDARFAFEGVGHVLAANLAPHAIHGLGFALPWRLDAQRRDRIDLSLELPHHAGWPFGGRAEQCIELDADGLRLTLAVHAGPRAMPAMVGWHPWFRRPERLQFEPTGMYPRDAAGIATAPAVPPRPGPWDDCFANRRPVALERGGQRLVLESDCTHWVVYDQRPDATCVEPQSGPPDAFNNEPCVLQPGSTLARWFRMAWSAG